MEYAKKPELLAPAGTTDAVVAVLDAGADAVYLGGKTLNMRMHRSSYNLDNDGVAEAIALTHERGAKLYYTLNSLTFEDELSEVRHALAAIGELGPDALIVQDIGVASLAREVCVHVPLHASTMMNVHNAETAAALKMTGFTRFIASRDIPLHLIREVATASGLEAECFVHGDMCIAQSAQCHLSGIAFGESSNRGRCMKPCRWCWELAVLKGDSRLARDADGYLLARKDLCLYQHIPALVENGIAALKIEGRMRTADYLTPLVAAYRAAIDAYFDDPFGYATDAKAMWELKSRRTREFSTCQTFGHQGTRSVDPSGKREARFFSHEAPEPELTRKWSGNGQTIDRSVALVAHVAGAKAAEAAVEAGADAVYLGGDVFVRRHPEVDVPWLAGFAQRLAGENKRVGVLSPRITDAQDIAEWRWMLKQLKGIPGLTIGASNLGALRVASKARFRDILADFSLNVTNSVAADELSTFGASRVTAAIELNAEGLTALADASRMPLEVLVHGPLPGMILEYCIIAAAAGETPEGVCDMDCRRATFALRDPGGQDHRIECDRRCRNHLFMATDVCALPNLPRLLESGVAGIRIEGQFDGADAVAVVVDAYRQALDALKQGKPYDVDAGLTAIREATGRTLSDGPFAFAEA